MADTNQTRTAFVEETAFGTTPSSNLQLLRTTGGTLTPRRTTVTSDEIRDDLRSGEPVRTSEWAEGDVNVEWSYGTLDDILEGVLMNAWASNVLIDGTTEKSYTFEEQIVDPTFSPDQYMIYKGCRIASLSMSLALESIVTGSFSVMGATPSNAQASAGTGNTDPNSNSPFNTVDMVTTLTEGAQGGSEASLSRIVGVDLTLTRALRTKMEIGALNPFDIGVGRLSLTGSVQQYFEDDSLVSPWFNYTERGLTLVLDDGAGTGNSITIEIPRLKYVGDLQIDKPGPDDDVLVTANFEAWGNVDDTEAIKFTRSAA